MLYCTEIGLTCLRQNLTLNFELFLQDSSSWSPFTDWFPPVKHAGNKKCSTRVEVDFPSDRWSLARALEKKNKNKNERELGIVLWDKYYFCYERSVLILKLCPSEGSSHHPAAWKWKPCPYIQISSLPSYIFQFSNANEENQAFSSGTYFHSWGALTLRYLLFMWYKAVTFNTSLTSCFPKGNFNISLGFYV